MNYKALHKKGTVQLLLGLLMGIIFGFLLQKGGVTEYDVIIGQLLLYDFTVLKVIFSAVLVGMVGLYILHHFDLITYHIIKGSVGATVIGGLIFGIGFGLLGYCPGTAAGALGQGWLDALFGGIIGLIIGTGIFAALYPRLLFILNYREFTKPTLYEWFRVKPCIFICFYAAGILVFFYLLEMAGL